MARDKTCVGIDIGASSVKLCQLKGSDKKGWALESFGMVPLPSETIVDGALMNSARVVEAVQELIQTHKLKNKQAAISVSGHSVIIKKIPMPQMTREELEESMQWEAEQFIPFDIADVNLDVQIVNPESQEAGQMDVVLVAAKKDYINEYTSVIMEAGLDPVVCDVDSFAIENMFETNYADLSGEGVVALINIGAVKTNINILSNGISSFTRDLTVGGNAFTEEIQRQAGVSRDEAEALKLGGTGNSDDTQAVIPENIQNALLDVSESVTNEIQRSLDFYSATTSDPSPEKIYLSGGTARLRALKDTLTERLGVDVEIADPFRRIDLGGNDPTYIRSIAPSAAVVIGLALRYPGDSL